MGGLNFIPRGIHQHTEFRERSILRSPLDSDSRSHQWKHLDLTFKQSRALTDQSSQIRQQIGIRRRGPGVPSISHPFQLYQFPIHLRRFIPADAAWRVKVRMGLVLDHGGSGSGDFWYRLDRVYGTDNVESGESAGITMPSIKDTWTSAEEIIPNDDTTIGPSWHEVVVPQDGLEYYFWVTYFYSGPGLSDVMFGHDNTDCLDMATGATGINDPWPSFPYDDPYHRLIGKAVVGPTFENGFTTKVLTLCQYAFDNISFTCGGFSGSGGHAIGPATPRFMGAYSANQHYYQSDIVTVDSTDFISQFIYWYPDATAYPISGGPIINIDPTTHTPDPWMLLSQSPKVNTINWANGPFDGSKSFLRKT